MTGLFTDLKLTDLIVLLVIFLFIGAFVLLAKFGKKPDYEIKDFEKETDETELTSTNSKDKKASKKIR